MKITAVLDIFERYKKAIGRIAKPVKVGVARSTDVKMPFGNDESVTHEKFFGENIARVKAVLRSEQELIQIAQDAELESDANAAMKELRERFSSDYIWCEDCDGLVTKLSECCLTRIENEKGDTSGTDCIF